MDAAAGWFIAGSASPARSLASIAGIRIQSSSTAAAAATHGFMVAQLYVSSPFAVINWKMGATLRRTDGTTSNASFQFFFGHGVPAPGAAVALAAVGLIRGRRRRG